MPGQKRCTYCAEEIPEEATRCRFCRSRLVSFVPACWHRDHPEARLGGVCAALSRSLALPLAAVRIAFIVLAFFHFTGVLLYGALWLVIPPRFCGESRLERLLGWALAQARWLSGRTDGAGRIAGRSFDGT